jgi:hypothetical protein
VVTGLILFAVQVRVLNAKDLSHNTAFEAHNCMITAFYADDCHVVTGGKPLCERCLKEWWIRKCTTQKRV